MANILTNLLKANLDAQRRAEYPGVASIELQSQNDATRAYAKIVAVTEGWMLHREIEETSDGRRILHLVIAENAVTDAVDTLLTESMVMSGLKAFTLSGQRYECRNPVKPKQEPRYYAVECEWIGAV